MKMIYILFACVCIWSCAPRAPLDVYTPVSELAFADSDLRACVVITAKDNQWPEAGYVKTLRCNNAEDKGIANLDGIEHLTNLDDLDLAHNQITTTESLTKLPQLQFIDLSFNKLKTFSSPDARHITYLNLDHNRIEKLDWLKNWLSLEIVSLSHNRIVDIAGITDKTTLLELDLSHNNISDATALSPLTGLIYLDLSQNHVTDTAALVPLVNLEILLMSANPNLGIGSLSELTQLHELVLDDDNISDITSLRTLTRLQRVSLRNNQLTSIEPLYSLGGLTYIDLTGNLNLRCDEFHHLVEIFGADVVQPATCPREVDDIGR